MPYNTKLADRVREYLVKFTTLKVKEKKMFRGLAFLVNGKMCVNVSGENLMCRFDPELTMEVAERKGFMALKMKKRELKGYCYVEPEGFKNKKDFEYWMDLCLDFNERAKASNKAKRKSDPPLIRKQNENKSDPGYFDHRGTSVLQRHKERNR